MQRKIEWWSVPGNRKRVYDAMPMSSNPVESHRCHISSKEPTAGDDTRPTGEWRTFFDLGVLLILSEQEKLKKQDGGW
jgi:hypothetical protein